MTDDDSLGLTVSQHGDLGRLVLKDGNIHRREVPQHKSSRYPGICRVMVHAEDFPIYTPKTPREVAVFGLNVEGYQKTIEMFGENLEGALTVTIDGNSFTLDCQATTEELRAAAGLQLRDCRVTAFPGLWEFAFTSSGRWKSREPVVTAVPFVPQSDPWYDGSVLVIDEGWVSLTEDGDTFATIEVTDCLPYLHGEVKRGAIAVAHWSQEAGWIVGQWRCRAFSFEP